MDIAQRLDDVLRQPADERLNGLTTLGRELLAANGTAAAAKTALLPHLLAALEGGEGRPVDRLALGEVLGAWGDPRLRLPDDPSYWAQVNGLWVGRFPVTNAEFRAWIDGGGYQDAAAWRPEGRAWLASCENPWGRLGGDDADRIFLVPNQPVVGITWWEADAYARAAGARLLTADERMAAVRGDGRRPYPWGEPFGAGNANTREEVLRRPCAVGLFVKDRTPEGVCDLAGNVGEWLADEVGAQRLCHPGAWNQPSMASWAKAKDLLPPDARSAGLGFRLARD